MADTETPETGTTTTTEEPTATTETKPDEGQLGDAGKRALDAERAARKAAEKKAAEALAKVQEFEDAGKSELEKLQTTAADAAKRAETAESKLARIEAAIAAKLPLDLADRLQGSTPEELAADAAKLAALVKTEEGEGATPPSDSLDGGARKSAPGGMSRDEVRKLAKDNPRKLNELIDAGKISLADLS